MPSSDHPVDASSSAAEPITVKDPEKEDEEEETPLPPRMAIITFALALSTFLAAVDVTIVTTALPNIAASLHASQSGYSWIGSAYLLTFAALTPFWGKVSDVFGRKPVLLVACVVLLVGSLICGLANSVAMLLAGRAVQGAGGGGLVVLVQITIGDLVSMRLVTPITPSLSTCI
jgi:MFS family permease